MHWRRKWQPTPVFLPGESQGWGSLVGCRLRGRTESDTNEATWQQQQQLPFRFFCMLVFILITLRGGSEKDLAVIYVIVFLQEFYSVQPYHLDL